MDHLFCKSGSVCETVDHFVLKKWIDPLFTSTVIHFFRNSNQICHILVNCLQNMDHRFATRGSTFEKMDPLFENMDAQVAKSGSIFSSIKKVDPLFEKVDHETCIFATTYESTVS